MSIGLLLEVGQSAFLTTRKYLQPTELASSDYFCDRQLISSAPSSIQLMIEADVAYWVGFQDPSYFSKVFKKELGKSPSQFWKVCEGSEGKVSVGN